MIIKMLRTFFFPHTDENNPLKVNYEKGVEYDAWVLSNEGKKRLSQKSGVIFN